MEPSLLELIIAGPELVCEFGTLATLVATLASTASTIVTSADAKKARAGQREAREASAAAASEVLRKEQLLSSKQNRLRQRRAAGSGQGTILGTSGDQQAEIGRNVLLGQ